MSFDCAAYRSQVDSFETVMAANSDLADIRLAPDKWTLKEMIGHLIDSATNNHQRFMRLQLEAVLTFPIYDAEEWKNVTKITVFDYTTLITLWKTYNGLLLHLVAKVDPKTLDHIWRRPDKDITLEALIHDYFVHLELHRVMFVDRVAEIRDKS